jgi:hypothetical protein
MGERKPKTAADTLVKIEQNTNRIATAMERLAKLLEESTFVYRPYDRHPGARYIRVHTSND